MKVDKLDRALRILITLLVYGVYIAMVFFSLNGNYLFLLTFEYWFATISTTMLSLFLRWLYSDNGVEKELANNDKIRGKEEEKGRLIQQVLDRNLTDKLDDKIKKTNANNKLEAYKTKCDRKINFYREKTWWKQLLGRKSKLNKWKRRKEEIGTEGFNINIYNVSYYKYDIDEMLSTFYKNPKDRNNRRRTKNQKVLNSTKSNLITFLAIATLKGIEYTLTDFNREDIIVLVGQLIAFTLNIYSGLNLGKEFIKEDYSSNLSDDIVFLKSILKES